MYKKEQMGVSNVGKFLVSSLWMLGNLLVIVVCWEVIGKFLVVVVL